MESAAPGTSRTAPALAGICTYADAFVVGVGVEETVLRLRRLIFLKSALTRLMAAHFCGVPEWEVKGGLGLHLWQNAEHSSWLRHRVMEMRTPPYHLDRVPAKELEAFADELWRAEDTLELLTGIYAVAAPAIAAALERHLAEAHPIADQPTRRLFRFLQQEQAEQIAWGGRALEALLAQAASADTKARVQGWRNHLERYLGAAGGVLGVAPAVAPRELPPPRARQEFVPTRVPHRDERFQQVWNSRGVVPPPERPVHERVWWMMNVRLQEMHVPELIATVMADWKDQPWEFYHDLARHLWDEVRHSMLGEIAFVRRGIDFTRIPTHVGFAALPNTHYGAPERYAFLWGVEQGMMVKTGKQAEVALAQAGHDDRATVYQDFDWADEVLHAQIGRKWLESHFGDREKMQDAYEKIRVDYERLKHEDIGKPGRDWWPAFYEEHLRHLDPDPGRSAADATPGSIPSY